MPREAVAALGADDEARALPRPTPRTAALAGLPGKADALVGMRRVGKTRRMDQHLGELLDQRTEPLLRRRIVQACVAVAVSLWAPSVARRRSNPREVDPVDPALSRTAAFAKPDDVGPRLETFLAWWRGELAARQQRPRRAAKGIPCEPFRDGLVRHDG